MEVIDYREDLDKDLITLSYRSLFHQRDEFEYVRVPTVWKDRYERTGESIRKVMIEDGKIIASLGLIIREGIVGGRKMRVGCFVDNCILPDYRNRYDELFKKLFAAIEEEARKRNVSVIYGWDFVKHLRHHTLFTDLGFEWVEGINWFPGGSYPFGIYPSNIWKLMFGLYGLYFKLFSVRVPKLPEGCVISHIQKEDYEDVVKLINSNDAEFSSEYSVKDFVDAVNKNDILGVIVRKDKEAIGVLTCIVSAWSGWMFGKPHYHEKWKHFFSYTPDEFIIKEEYQSTSIPSRMVIEMMNLKDPADMVKHSHFNFLVDVFDRRISWRRKAYERLGFTEPKFDHGVILAKSLHSGIKIDKAKPWHLPARFILAPVPLEHLSRE